MSPEMTIAHLAGEAVARLRVAAACWVCPPEARTEIIGAAATIEFLCTQLDVHPTVTRVSAPTVRDHLGATLDAVDAMARSGRLSIVQCRVLRGTGQRILRACHLLASSAAFSATDRVALQLPLGDR